MHGRLIAGAVIASAASIGAAALMFTLLLHNERAGARPTESPGGFVARVVAQIVSDDYAAAWETLYPPHQAIAGSDEYVSCETRTPVGWKLRSIAVIRVTDRKLRVPGDSQQSFAKAVTLRLRLAKPALGVRDVFTHTFNAVAVNSHWRWILTQRRYKLYLTDSCASGYAPSP